MQNERQSKSLLVMHRTVFSRFCKCGGNVTIGLLSDDGYIAAELKWNEAHSGTGHALVSRHEWLIAKLSRAA
jgi:hypothetical protein